MHLQKALIIIAGFFILGSCKTYQRNKSHENVSLESIKKGEELATQYCHSCHQLPNPSLLDAKTWETGVLPAMGPRLGIFAYGFKEYPSYRSDVSVDKNFYPSQPVLSSVQWQHIIDYYTATSPDSLNEQQQRQPIDTNLSQFAVHPLSWSPAPAATCFVSLDSTLMPRRLLTTDLLKRCVRCLNPSLQVADSAYTDGPIVNIDRQQNNLFLCNIGLLNPTNTKVGSLTRIPLNASGNMQPDTSTFITQLARPVQVKAADLNADGNTDYIICEFGNLTGCLSWFENKGQQGFERHILRPTPGAIQVYVQDYNHDGLPDIWALFAQGEEGIFLFTNKGHGQFTSQEVLQFPPVYGSTSFELVDFNKDGRPDIIYTCGDNADYSPVLKPYHGVYVFMNEGDLQFKQQFFFHINGCYKAIARDYDNDGDIDLAAISFFADYTSRPQEGFVYLDNDAGKWHAHTFSLNNTGRWLTMSAGDLDGDGYIDLALGNFSLAPATVKSSANWQKGPAVLFLQNRGKR